MYMYMYVCAHVPGTRCTGTVHKCVATCSTHSCTYPGTAYVLVHVVPVYVTCHVIMIVLIELFIV